MQLWKNLDAESKRTLSLDVKKVNQRLREIEKQGLQNSSNWYQYIAKQQFDGNKAFTTDSKGRVKLRTDFASITNASTITKIKDVTEYTLNKGKYEDKGTFGNTSTKTGMQKKYKKAYEQYKKTTGNKTSFDDYVDLWKNEKFCQLVKQYGYSEVMRMLSETPLNVEDAIDIMYDCESLSEMRRALNLQEEFNGMTQEEIDAMFSSV